MPYRQQISKKDTDVIPSRDDIRHLSLPCILSLHFWMLVSRTSIFLFQVKNSLSVCLFVSRGIKFRCLQKRKGQTYLVLKL